MKGTREHWDVDIDSTRIGLERAARALIETGSQLLDSSRIGKYPLGRGITVFLRVAIPPGEADRFREISRPIAMRPAQTVSV